MRGVRHPESGRLPWRVLGPLPLCLPSSLVTPTPLSVSERFCLFLFCVHLSVSVVQPTRECGQVVLAFPRLTDFA